MKQTCRSCGFIGDQRFCANCGTEFGSDRPAAAPVAEKGKSNCLLWGVVLTLIGFFVLAAVGIIAAIAVPNFLHALQRAKQERAAIELAELARVIEANHAIEQRPLSDDWMPLTEAFDGLSKQVGPLSLTDPWEGPYLYRNRGDGYWLASFGSDGLPDVPAPEGLVSEPTQDLLLRDGEMVSWPGPPPGGR